MMVDVSIDNVVDELKARIEDFRNIANAKISEYLDSIIPQIYTNLNEDFHKWEILDFEACPECITNSEWDPYDLGPGITKKGEAYPSGHNEAPAHPNCRCTMVELTPDNTSKIEVNGTAIEGANVVSDYLPQDIEQQVNRIAEETVGEIII